MFDNPVYETCADELTTAFGFNTFTIEPDTKWVEPVSSVIVRVVDISPPPVKPLPVVMETEVWFICSFATYPVVELWDTCDDADTVPLGNREGI